MFKIFKSLKPFNKERIIFIYRILIFENIGVKNYKYLNRLGY
jgi:hypothetical protein